MNIKTFLSFVSLIFLPFFISINYIFSFGIVIYRYINIKINLPIYIFLAFIIYDLMNLLLLNMDVEFNFLIFHGFILAIVTIHAIYFKLYNNNFLLYSLAYFVLSSIYGLYSGASVVHIINFLKALFVFPILMLLQNQLKWTFSNIHLILLLFILSLSILLSTVQNIYGFENFFIDYGYDLVYYQRGLSELGKIPMGIYTYNHISNEAIVRHMGIFISPDKFSYLVYTLLLFVFFYINKLFRINFLFFVLLFLTSFYILYLTNVKAILLNYLVFFSSLFLFNYFRVKGFIKRCCLLGLSATIAAYILINFTNIDFSNSGAITHIWSLERPIVNMFQSMQIFLFGEGAGVTTSINASGEILRGADTGHESFVGKVIFSTGIIGFLLYSYLFYRVDLLFKQSQQYAFISSVIIGVYISTFISSPVLSFFQVSCYILSIQIFLSYKKIPQSRL
jgi:hypothetical protein